MVKYNYNEPYYKLRFGDLEDNKLKILSFEGEENISDLFKYSFELLSDDPEIDTSKILNKKAVFEITRGDEDPILIYGIISQFEQKGRNYDYVNYHAVLVPTLWRLNLTFRNEVYQAMNIEELVSKVLNDSGMSSSDFTFDLMQTYPTLEYVAQYRETNYDFIKRKLEHYGIFFYFDHSDDKDEIIFTDSNDKLNKIEQMDELYYNSNKDPLSEMETISHLTCKESIVTGAVKLKDYNYMYPEKQVIGESNINTDAPGIFYDYGDNFSDEKEAEALAKVRNEEIIARSKIFEGTSDCRLLHAGNIFNMQKHYRNSWNSEYVVVGITCKGTQRSLFGILPPTENIEATYENKFSAIPFEINYRPPRITPIPKVSGIMSAKIESSSGDEYASMDDQGRYKAKMLFDLSENSDAESSAPIRLSQPYSGAGYGMHFPNHAGTELLWACVDGNVDRPIGLGTAPNPSNTSPSTSGNRSQGVIRTAGNNEINLDDSGGKEQIHIKQECGNEILMDAEGPDIEIKQKCGNEILMKEAEGIQIRDKFGNEIVLDSEAGTMKLRSPSHESVMELGKSIKSKTLSTLEWAVAGDEIKRVEGKTLWECGGNLAKLTYGVTSEEFIGAKHTSNLALLTELSLALKLEKNMLDHVTKAKKLKIDASKSIDLIAGKDDSSEIMMNTDKINMNCGDSYILVHKNGLGMVAKKTIILSANGQIYLESKKGEPIMFKATETKIKGKIKQKNLTAD